MGFLDAISSRIASSQINAGAYSATGAAIGGQSSGQNPFSSGSKLFAENTAGINTSFQTGDQMFIAAQAGRSAGVGRSLGIA